MTRREEPADRIRKAHNLVVRAANCWNAGSVAAVEESVAALEASAAELRALEVEAGGYPDSLRGFRSEILQIKDRVSRIERLPRLAAAFLYGRPETQGDSPLYRAGGSADTDSSFITTTRIQA